MKFPSTSLETSPLSINSYTRPEAWSLPRRGSKWIGALSRAMTRSPEGAAVRPQPTGASSSVAASQTLLVRVRGKREANGARWRSVTRRAPGETSIGARATKASACASALLVWILAGVIAASGVEARASEGGGGAGDRERALEEIRERVAESRRELSELEAAETGVDAELRRLSLELDLQQQLVSEAAAEREIAQSDLAQTQKRVEELNLSLEETRLRLEQRLVDLNRAAPANWLRGFLTVEAPSDFFLYVRTLRFFARRDARLLPTYRQERIRLDAERERLAQRQAEVAGTLTRERRRLTALADAKRRQSLVVSALERERSRIERRADSLGEKEQKLALLVAALSRHDDHDLSRKRIQDFRGALDWPLAGDVSVPFGPRYEPRYGTRVPHNGVRITATGDGTVTTVFPGVVVFAAPFEGFGLTAVVHHREQVFSLYAGLESLEVERNDVLALGDVLGSSGAAVYFEIRVENRPEDPLIWLR